MNSLNSNSSNSVHLVLQRYRSCKILLNETEWVTQGGTGRATKGGGITLEGKADENVYSNHHHHDSTHCGLLIYVSFAKNINAKSCWEAAETCCNVPILTNGLWGDTTSELFSLKQIVTSTTNDDSSNDMKGNNVPPQTSVTIVPQANLICTMKRHGTSIQYHNQISKEDGRYYYDLFVHYIRANLYEYYYIRTQQDIPPSLLEWKLQSMTTKTTTTENNSSTSTTTPETMKLDPSIPPMDIFRTTSLQQSQLLYGSFDPNTGLPITDIHNLPLTKSALKKLRKIQDVHRTKHEKWLQQQQQPSSIPTSQSTATDRNDDHTGIVSTTNTTSTITAIPSTPSIADREEPFLLLKSSSSSCPPPPPPVPIETPSFLNPSWTYDHGIVVAGTFGKRQGLEIVSDMGPFCHTIQI